MTKRIFVLIMAAVFLLCLYFIQITVKYPHLGITVIQNQNGQYEVTNVVPNGAAQSSGIQKGDILLSINEKKPIEHDSVQKYSLVEKATTLEIERDGNIKGYDFQRKYYNSQVLLHIMFPIFFLIVFFFVSLYLMNHKKNEKVTSVLIILLQIYGLSTIAAGASARTDMLAQFFSISTLLLIPFLFLYFFFFYFQKFNIVFVNRRLLKILTFLNLLVLSFILVFLLLPINNQFYPITRLIILFTFMINAICCIYFFGRGYLKYRHTFYSSLYKIILVGIVIAFFPFIFLYAMPVIIVKQELISGEVSFLFTYFLPLSFAYLVGATQFFDIDFYIKRIYYYSSLSILPTIVLTIIGGILLHEVAIMKWIQIFVIIFLVFICIFYMKEEVDYRFRSKLFSEKNNLKSSIYQFVAFLSREKNKKVIEQYFINEVKSVLGLKKIALLEYDKERNNLYSIHGDTWPLDMKLLHKQLSQYSGKYFLGELVVLDSLSYLVVSENSKKMLVVAFAGKNNFTAINLEEKEWLKTISYNMNVSYQNLHMIEELIDELEMIKTKEDAPSWVLKMLFRIEENERKRLSIDLHDSALQDQLLLYRKLSGILETNHFLPPVKEELLYINEGLLDVIHEIRETCNDLMPPFLKETGIVGALENLIKKVQLRTNMVVDFVPDRSFAYDISDETTLTIYRIVQELMNNAEKHANASKICLYLTSEHDQIILQYKDNGIGLEDGKISTFNDRLGIYGIKERVRSVAGQINFYNAKQVNGLEIVIEIPLKKDNSVLVRV